MRSAVGGGDADATFYRDWERTPTVVDPHALLAHFNRTLDALR